MLVRRWFGRLAANILLLAASLAVSYLVIGAAYLAFGPLLLPALINYFPVTATIWWQPSSPHPERESYIALLGDSYAAGIGDWQAERRTRTDSFHSADVIRMHTGRPVLSFGRSGAGSAEAMVLQPAEALDAARCLIFPQPRTPSEVVIYFYEGNDLDNNIAYVEEVLEMRLDDPNLSERIFRQLREGYGVADRTSCLAYFALAVRGMVDTVLFMARAVTEPLAANPVFVGNTVQHVPGGLQGPAMELDAAEISAALLVTARSLEWLKARLPGIPITVVFVPSVLTVYRMASPTVTVQVYHDGERTHPAQQVSLQSDAVCAALSAIVAHQQIRFVDARPALRTLARDALVHGPQDWRHFNRLGYTRLGETVAAVLTGGDAPSDCARLADDLPE